MKPEMSMAVLPRWRWGADFLQNHCGSGATAAHFSNSSRQRQVYNPSRRGSGTLAFFTKVAMR